MKEGVQYSAACFLANMISHKKHRENPANYITKKGSYSLYCQAIADHKHCVIDVVIRWPGSFSKQNIFKFIVKSKLV